MTNFPFMSSNIYVILGLVIFRTELSCLCKSYANKATLLLVWSHRYKHFTVIITNIVPNVACVSELSSFCDLCLMLPVSLDCLHSVSCAQCCLCLWIVFILCLVPSVACVSGLSSFCVLYPVLPVSLDCLHSVSSA
jgi:hypothetical protein